MTSRAYYPVSGITISTKKAWCIAPLASAVLMALANPYQDAHAQLRGAWFTQSNAAQQHQNANNNHAIRAAQQAANMQQQQAAARAQLSHSLDNLNRTASAIAAQQAAQNAARLAAQQQASNVAEGLAQGGLEVAVGDKAQWLGAEAPVHTQQNGQHHVGIKQTNAKAILNWNRFDVGRNTTVEFQQKNTDAVLNRVVGDQVAPSQIQGRIKGDGTVMVVNQNGIVFSGTSQVNVRNLVAAAATITDDQFLNHGIYSPDSKTPAFKQALGKIEIQAGAQIHTHQAENSTTGGGYVLVLAKDIQQHGTLTAQQGQVALAAGDSFIIRKGQGTEGNQQSTVRGNEVLPSGQGSINHTGLIQARAGDISLSAHSISQAGVLSSTTTQNQRGTVHLTATEGDANILLASHSVTAIEVEHGGQALDSQRDSTIAANWLGLNDRFRGDLSLIRITSTGTVDLATESLTLATGGQIAINAAQRSLVRKGARLDVSGALEVPLAMAVNNLEINVQGNEQRDSPNNRDSKNLNNQTIWLDRRFLVHVPDGTNGYQGDRWYSQGGLLEVGGYLSNTTHSTAEWLAQGGTVQFSGGDVVTQQGSQINLSGGTLAVQSGHLKQSWLRGDDGRLYRADTAPGDRLYQPGVFTGYVQESTRWGGKRSFASPLLAPQQRFEHGYLVGRDAGRLIIDTPNAVLEGELISAVYNSPRQHTAAPTEADGYGLPHHTQARRAQLVVGHLLTFYQTDQRRLAYQFNPRAQSVILDSLGEAIAHEWELDTALPQARQNTIYVNTDTLNSDQLSALRIATHNTLALHGDLKLANGAHLQFYSPDIHLGANITVPSGKVEVGNVLHQIDGNGYRDFWLNPLASRTAQVLVAPGVTITTQGLWNNLTLGNPTLSPYIHGGSVSLRSTGDIILNENSLINVSAGATLNQPGHVQGGRGGNLRLEAGFGNKAGADIHLQGQLQGHGFQQAGTLHWHQNSAIELGTGLFDAGFFSAGFAHYHIASLQDISLEQELHILRPVLQPTATAADMGSGHHGSLALQPYLPPLYLADHTKRSITQRAGANLTLTVGSTYAAPDHDVALFIGDQATLSVDPGQTIQLYSVGDIHIAGRMNAWGGKIEIGNLWQGQGTGNLFRTVTLAPSAYLDVAGRAFSAVDPYGKAYGLAPAGGTIQISGKFNHNTGTIGRINIVTNQPAGADSHFIKVHQGAVLNASGTQVALDFPHTGTIQVASQGGSISLASSAGLYLDGQFIAHAGGPGAAGGHLILALDTPIYGNGYHSLDSPVRQAREFILAQDYQATTQQNLTYGHARFAAQQLLNSGITTLSLHSDGALSMQDQVVLHLPQAINLYAWVYAQAENSAFTGTSFITAPYIKIASPGSLTGGESGTFHPTYSNLAPSTLPARGTLHLHASALLDLQGDMSIGGGAQKYISSTNPGSGLAEEVQRAGFNKLILQSEGEIRLLRSQPTVQFTRVRTPANLSLMATQLYPGTHANTMLQAGWRAAPDSQYTLTIERSTPQTPASLPYSVFGRLIVEAPVIVHQGVVRAPLGQILLGSGASGAGVDYTQHLLVAPGSETSVSAKGLAVPYGGTIDQLNWRYLNEVVLLHGAGHPLAGHIALGGQYIDVADNAIIDLSGGGTLTGAGFVSGRGGSTDARYHPLMQYQGNSFTLPSQQDRAIYAIVPSHPNATAPLAEQGSSPAAGQQITLGHHLPGLPAGTYTLLPASYALLPGAFRVELLLNNPLPSAAPTAMPNGSWAASGTLSQAHTGIEHSLAHRITLTPADTLRRYANYNETSYADFVHIDAARRGVPRAQTEADGKLLRIHLRKRDTTLDTLSLRWQGTILGQAAQDGYGSSLAITSDDSIEVLPNHATPNASYDIAILGSDFSHLNINRLSIGGLPRIDYNQTPNLVEFSGNAAGVVDSGARGVIVRSGALLSAPEIMLISRHHEDKGIEVEQGAILSTLGRGLPAFSANHGYIFQPTSTAVVALSNGPMRWLAPKLGSNPSQSAPIALGGCATDHCQGLTRLYSEGSLAFLTSNQFSLNEHVRYGTRHLSLGASTFHIGSPVTLEQAASAGVLPPGLRLTEPDFQRLLQGDTDWGAPAMETLELIAGSSMNFFGDVTLSTFNSQGQSTMDNLLLTTPAIYGYGTDTDTAAIHTGHLIWNGSSQAAGDVVHGGAGTGDGSFHIDARRITLGFGPWSQPDGDTLAARLLLGFKQAQLTASTAFSANNEGKLSFYHRRGFDYDTVNGYQYSSGHLHIHTPLLTGSAGSSSSIVAGGDIRVSNPYGAASGFDALNALGAELSLQAGGTLHLNTAVLLPSGKLGLKAQHHLDVGAHAHIDMAGRTVTYFDDAAATQYSWGGDVYLESLGGNITQAPASIINLSAINNQAGRLSALASHADHGMVLLQGQILGQASGHYNAGGTVVPYLSGGLIIQAQTLGHSDLSNDFAALNQRLNTGEVFGLRRFQLLQGDLRVGDELRAHEIDLSLDAGHLSVQGKIDASGAQVGSIRLAAQNGLHLGSQALLDAHGTLARIDSYGQLIYAPNRAIIELNSGLGQLHSQAGAQLDLRYGTDDARLAAIVTAPRLGEVHLYAPRIDAQGHSQTAAAIPHGDLAIHIEPGLQLQGAHAVAVYGRTIYDDAPYGTDPAASGKDYQVITQDYLNAKHQQSTQFINAALANAHLRQHKLAGLTQGYGDILHLRPAIDLVSATADGDLIVSGDLDVSGHRYASLNPHRQQTALYGSGEPGSLAIRAGGNLSIYGSINDGFAPPPETPDDNGWVLTPGTIAFGGEIIVPGSGVVLGKGTQFASGKTLNYAIPIQPSLAAGVELPVTATLSTNLDLAAGYVFNGPVYDANGQLLHAAGSVLQQATTLAANTQLGAGFKLPARASFHAFTWPAGVPLPETLTSYTLGTAVQLVTDLPLRIGSLIPSMTDVKLPHNALSTPLRPTANGRMGQNWAIAAMLPENSLSWNLRVLAGADTEAVDSRSLQQAASGEMTLSDSHYTLFTQRESQFIPGQPAQPGGAWFWNEAGTKQFGFALGSPVPSIYQRYCSRGYCDVSNYAWNEAGSKQFGFPVGYAVPTIYERYCARGFCERVGEARPGTPDQTIIGRIIKHVPVSHVFSVLRTGTGHLDLISQGSIQVQSPYGIYTAGTHTASAATSQEADFNRDRAKAADGTYLNSNKSMAPSDGSSSASGPGYESVVNGGPSSTYAAWYPEQGGNLVLRTGSNLSLDNWSAYLESGQDTDLREINSSGLVSNWLWRQASGNTYGIDPIATAWWLNFGTYISGTATRINNYLQPTLDITNKNSLIATPELIGFTGLGTLGGGNLQIDIRGAAGTQQRLGRHENNRPRSQALNLAVASTGRVLADGSLLQTGGGDLQLRIAQGWNPSMAARARMSPSYGNQQGQNPNLLGTVTNLRGDTYTLSSTLGGIKQFYTHNHNLGTDLRDTRAYDPYAQQRGFANGGITLVLGDSPARVHTRGDLVLTGTADPTRLATPYTLPYSYLGQTYGSGGEAWFSLWTPNTAIQLFSAGGHAAPMAQSYITPVSGKYHHAASDGWQVYPSQLQVIAASGSIFVQHSEYTVHFTPLLLAPSALGQLSLIAKQSIYTAGLSISRSGNLNAINSPFKPAFMSRTGTNYDLQAHNLAENAMYLRTSLFTFGVPNAALSNNLDSRPSRFYAQHGDIIGLESGGVIDFGTHGARANQIWYEGHAPVWMRAGRDIVRSGNVMGTGNRTSMPNALGSVVGKDTNGFSFRTGNLFVHHHANDVSIVEAGRDILFSNFQVAGPGTLEISAGRNISMADQSINPWTREVTIINTRFHSLGPIVPGDHRPGAGIAVQAGMSPGAQWDAFLQHYLDPANAAIVGTPLADQAGKVVKTYHDELITWLEQRYGFEADGEGDAVEQARAYFAALGREQQRIFARDLYFAELRAGGREYNDANGPRAGSYLRGRQAIAALFPTTNAQGQPIHYQGDVLMYGASGVHTDVGGDIQILTPGGAQIYGIEGSAIPPATAGLITRGQGNIQMYSLGSILLGQSRIMTTFGGDILAWSAQGDINAGRGAKTTQIFTPPRRVYDDIGNVTINPDVPSTGAGIATLAPIAEVPPGDMDLIAPLGTIDAGEAGIRVSGNVNLAALHVVNAENIQVQGESKGIPIAVTVNVGALTSASSAATSAATAAQETLARTRDATRSNQPSQIQVQVLGFGSAQSSAPSQPAHSAKLAPTHYDYDKPVQIVGLGQSLTAASHKLSEDERNAILNP